MTNVLCPHLYLNDSKRFAALFQLLNKDANVHTISITLINDKKGTNLRREIFAHTWIEHVGKTYMACPSYNVVEFLSNKEYMYHNNPSGIVEKLRQLILDLGEKEISEIAQRINQDLKDVFMYDLKDNVTKLLETQTLMQKPELEVVME